MDGGLQEPRRAAEGLVTDDLAGGKGFWTEKGKKDGRALRLAGVSGMR